MLSLIDGFSRMRALVLGDCMLDAYLEGYSERLCREAPVPVVNVDGLSHAPGGAGNTAVNARGLGARVELLSVIGADEDGLALRQSLESNGVQCEHLIVDRRRQTLAKKRVVSSSQILLRFDEGTTVDISDDAADGLIERMRELWPECDVVIVSDYGYGIMTPKVLRAVSEIQERLPKVLVADSKHLSAFRKSGVTAVKPNYTEAVQLLGVTRIEDRVRRAEQIARHGERVLDLTGAQIAAVTLDAAGAIIFERNSPPYRTYAKPTSHSCATGAGDTFVSAFALALAAGAVTPAAAEMASAAASVVVGRDGTTACTAAELRARLSSPEKRAASAESLAERAEMYRRQKKRVVFTNGCFDILHRGHIAYLNRAKSLGDVLVVAVNSDESVRRLKGEGRPINPLDDRIQVLDALSCIDHIVAFDEDTPSNLIGAVRPDVFVKGGDYTRETIPEATLVESLGGEVEILPFVEDRSTTSIIEKIAQAYGEDAAMTAGTGWQRLDEPGA